ncbi:OLC1v1006782C1 [Oldenlandia corymbosa var. corymbosa]|uniref:OLC1v1006782C1 n=1 Tax=Oldenlandia corymbosa var. corymbosa TaxID=529605 RepID=A0AAV1DKV8_OLDCO|nr:OLC1v1006782C1 [Oldenlandia corymbosa var. corymbosa]
MLQNPNPPETDRRRLNVFLKPSALSRINCFRNEDSESDEVAASKGKPEGHEGKVAGDAILPRKSDFGTGRPFLATLVILLGVALALTLLAIGSRQPSTQQGSFLGIQCLADSSSSSAAITGGFSFKAFGYRIILPEYAPGWVYFWLLMAAGFGLFISEEALNIWVGITLSRMLTLDGSWQSFVDSFSRNATYIISTVMWVYWGVCISDMVPFYLGKLFRQSGASDDVCSKLGIGQEKAMSITRIVQRYGNLVGFVERFSLGVRNPTAFLAGAMDISPEYFFAGVCCGGLVTLPIQLGIGFLMRERPVFALATVATVVGAWTVLPYAAAALTAFFLYLRRRYSF